MTWLDDKSTRGMFQQKVHYDWKKKFHASPNIYSDSLRVTIIDLVPPFQVFDKPMYQLFDSQSWNTHQQDSSQYQDVLDSKQEPHAIASLSSFEFLSLIWNQLSPNPHQYYLRKHMSCLQMFRGQEQRFVRFLLQKQPTSNLSAILGICPRKMASKCLLRNTRVEM